MKLFSVQMLPRHTGSARLQPGERQSDFIEAVQPQLLHRVQ
jgi:hypothetical protein